MVPYRLWRFSHKFEHPKSTPYYFSLPLILSVTHITDREREREGSHPSSLPKKPADIAPFVPAPSLRRSAPFAVASASAPGPSRALLAAPAAARPGAASGCRRRGGRRGTRWATCYAAGPCRKSPGKHTEKPGEGGIWHYLSTKKMFFEDLWLREWDMRWEFLKWDQMISDIRGVHTHTHIYTVYIYIRPQVSAKHEPLNTTGSLGGSRSSDSMLLYMMMTK